MPKDRRWIYTECEKLEANQTHDDFRRHLERFTDSLGFDRFLYTALPNNYRLETEGAPYTSINSYDLDWMEYYLDQRYDIDDAALQHCLSGSNKPYIWPGSNAKHCLTPKQLQVFKEANGANLLHGFSYPLNHLPGALGIYTASFDGNVDQFALVFKEKWDAIKIFSHAFHEATLRQQAQWFGANHRPKLTGKEKEVLHWLSNGYSYDEIATKLCIGITTVKKHVQHVLEKTGAKNSSHACVLALRWGYI